MVNMDSAPTTASNRKKAVDGHLEPPYGSRLLPQVVDDLSRSNPKRVYATFPISSDFPYGFRDVTMLQVAEAVNKFAWWLEQNIGRSTVFETIAYIGPTDLRYAIVFLAAIKTGYKLLVPSVRNSVWMNISLLEQTKCTKFLYTTEMSQKAQDMRAQKKDMRILVVESLSDMLQGHTGHYPYEINFADARWNPVLILHSSGSTGLTALVETRIVPRADTEILGPPKPIQTNHATWAVADNDRNLPAIKGRKNQNYALWNFRGSGGRYFAAFPPFHLGGFVALVVLPIYSTTATVVLGPADRPPTGHLVSQIMQRYELKALFCPPTIFEQLVQEPEGLEQAKRLDFLVYAGGPLSSTTGDLLSQVTDVCQFYGSTETGAAQTLVPLREDWASLEWHPSWGADMQPSEDEAYELVLHRDPKLDGVRSFSCNFPNVEEWHTRDLFRPHPSKPNLWRFHGRTDDIIVLSNGEKFNPVPSEVIITGHPLVSGAVIVGLGRFQAALLIELRGEGGNQAHNLIEAIWPTVEQANAQAPGHARVIRSMITVADTNKRFERAGKGTIIRKMTADKFAPEIEALYSKGNLEGYDSHLAATNDMRAIQEYVRASIAHSFSVPDLKEDDDLYVLGLDSLKSVEIVGLLKAGLGASDTLWLSTQTIYTNPTIHKLSKVIYKGLNPQHLTSEESSALEQSRITKMAFLVEKHTQDLPKALPRKNQLLKVSELNVVLTGSTGSLGVHLLRTLLDDPKISKIYCLNRSAKGKEMQERIFASLGLDRSIDAPRVEFIMASYGQSQLGLPDERYNELTSTVDIIIHNAWKVDFNHSLESYEPVHIQGVRNLIDWSLRSSRHPHIIFISSTSSVGNWRSVYPNEPVPETLNFGHHVAQEMGYAESKNVSECILGIASERSGVPISILRVGQIAGPVSSSGIWNRDEWVHSLVKTSRSLKCFPNYIPDVDWIPVDTLAAAILDILHFTAERDRSWTYNMVNPESTTWASLINTVLKHLGPEIQVVELREWIHMLEQIDQTDTRQLISKPAAKIIDFFRAFERAKMEGKVEFSTAHGIIASKTIADLKPVNPGWMDIWLKQWGS